MQEAELKKTFPTFDLSAEMQNPAFSRMVLPGGGLSVEQAYWAVHHNELSKAKQAQTAQQVASALSKATAAGRSMPTENGNKPRASAAVGYKDYSQMNAAERAQYKADLKAGKIRY